MSFEYYTEDEEYKDDSISESLLPSDQTIYISLDKKQRKGKLVTILEEFVLIEADLSALCKKLKTTCGVGGTFQNNQILLQGDHKEKAKNLLISLGYNVNLKGG